VVAETKNSVNDANIDDVDKLVLSQEDEYAFLSQSVILYSESVSILLAQHQFVNSIDVGGRSRCSWPATTRLSCYRSSLFQTLNKVVQRTFLSSFSRKFIC